MGKKSRAKKHRREMLGQAGQSRGEQDKESMPEQESMLAKVLLYIIKGGVYLALFCPLIVSSRFYFPFVGPKSLYFMGLAQIIIFSWFGLMLLSRKYRPKLNFITITLLAFFVVLIISAVFGVNFSYSFWSKFERMTGILMWIHLVGFFLALSAVFKKERDWRRIFAVSVAAAVVVSILSLLGKGGSTRGGATIGNTSFMGTYLLFNVFFAIYLFFRKTNKFFRIFAAICFAIIALALFYSTARAAILCFLGGLYLLVLCYLAFKPEIKWLKIIGRVILVISLLAGLICGLLLFKQDSFVRERFIKAATQARLVVWEKAWKGFKERPLLGWGQENFEFVFTKYFNPCMFLSECGGEIWFDRAHNIIFDTLAATGILGFLIYISIFISIFFSLWKKYIKKKINFWACAVPSVILISYSVQNLTVFDMISSYLMFFLVLAFASAVTTSKTPNHPNTPNSPRQHWPLLILLLVLCFTFYAFIIQPARGGSAVIESLRAQDPEARLYFYQRAFTKSPMGIFQTREFLASNSQSSVQKALNADVPAEQINREAIKKELDLVAQELEKTAIESPLDFRSMLRLAHIYNIYSFFDEEKITLAEKSGRKAIELSPTNQQAYWALAQTRMYQQQYEEALTLAQQAVDLEPRVNQAQDIKEQIERFLAKKFDDGGVDN